MITYEQWKSLYVKCPNGGQQYHDFYFCPYWDMDDFGDLKKNTICQSSPKETLWVKDVNGQESIYLKTYDDFISLDLCFMTKEEAEKELERRKQNEMDCSVRL